VYHFSPPCTLPLPFLDGVAYRVGKSDTALDRRLDVIAATFSLSRRVKTYGALSLDWRFYFGLRSHGEVDLQFDSQARISAGYDFDDFDIFLANRLNQGE
jgi:hypothetical protein